MNNMECVFWKGHDSVVLYCRNQLCTQNFGPKCCYCLVCYYFSFPYFCYSIIFYGLLFSFVRKKNCNSHVTFFSNKHESLIFYAKTYFDVSAATVHTAVESAFCFQQKRGPAYSVYKLHDLIRDLLHGKCELP